MMIEVDGLTKHFVLPRGWRAAARAPLARERRTALDAVTFAVRAGEIFGVLGQNGAGKTTLFKLLSTLLRADAGRAVIAGIDVARDPRAVRGMLAAVLANERSLYWRLDARENLRLYATLHGLSAAETTREIARVLTVTALDGRSTQQVGTYSTGMRQRLLIARALLGRPRLLLLDEPTRGLDPLSAREFRTFVRQTLVAQEGCTVVLASHDAEDIWDLCDRVAILHHGRLRAVDTTATLRHQVGGTRYRLWVRSAGGDASAVVSPPSGIRVRSSEPAADAGWTEWRGEIEGGADGVAAVLAALHRQGVAVARCEAVPASLADVLAHNTVEQRSARPDGPHA